MAKAKSLSKEERASTARKKKKEGSNMANEVNVSREDFQEYKNVQESGDYNMFDPRAREMTDLSKDEQSKRLEELLDEFSIGHIRKSKAFT